jgi:hypothetical protein
MSSVSKVTHAKSPLLCPLSSLETPLIFFFKNKKQKRKQIMILAANKLTVSGMGKLEAEKRKCPTSKEGGAAKRHRGEGSCHSQEERPKETAQSQGADRGKGAKGKGRLW